MSQGTILIFRTNLLAPSETFIVAQAAAMRQFSPYFVGWRRMAGIAIPEDTSWTVDGGGLRGRLRRACAFTMPAPRGSRLRGCGREPHGWSMRTSLPMATQRCSLPNNSGCRW